VSTTTANNKRIAKNTIALYFRMMITMAVSLYTSRVILEYLGVQDYGIYNAVGGFVMMLSYLNSSLSAGSSRFLTYELGTGNRERLHQVFSSVLTVHILFALIILIIGETIGLWFVYNKINIPPDRIDAAIWCYHLSLLTCMMTITQAPYNASIISHERMKLYAYTSIIDVMAKLLVVYMLTLTSFDRLKVYAILLFIVSVSMRIFYRWYCVRHFEETRYNFSYDKSIIKEVLSYSGWNVFATTSVSLCTQGVTVITNMFFNPGVVAARAIANQVDHTARLFFTNFKTASNPQIVKSYAEGDYERSKYLVFQTAKFGYFLMLMLGLPIILVAYPLLKGWLGQVPEYSVEYLQFAILTSLAAVFDTTFYTALYAKGQIKENSFVSSLSFFVGFIVIFILFKLGFSPTWSAIVLFVSQCVIAFIIKPIMLVKIVNYRLSEILLLFADCLKVTIIAIVVPVTLYVFKSIFPNQIIGSIILVIVSVLSVALSSWFLGLDKGVRNKLISSINRKFFKNDL